MDLDNFPVFGVHAQTSNNKCEVQNYLTSYGGKNLGKLTIEKFTWHY